GFRVGGSCRGIGDDRWGVSASYTRFRTDAHNSGFFPGFVGIPSGFPLTGTLTDVDFAELFWLFAAQSFQARWGLKYNIFDFDVDHEFAATETLYFRPSLGIRGGWINQDILIRSIYVDSLANNAQVSTKEKLTNHFWGVGPRCGLNSKWCLGSLKRHSFYLF